MKFCPNCGEPVEGDTRFCTHCGFDLSQANATENSQATDEQPNNNQTTAPAVPNRMTQLQALSKNYFKWFWDSLKRPNEEVPAEKYFGIISMLINGLLVTFAIVIPINRSIMDNLTAYSVKKLPFSFELRLFVLAIIGIFIVILIGFIASMLGNKTGNVNFFDYTNRFGHVTNSVIIADLILVLAFKISQPILYYRVMSYSAFLALIAFIWIIGFILTINNSIEVPRIDKFYIILLALIVLAVALFCFVGIEGDSFGKAFNQLLSEVQ